MRLRFLLSIGLCVSGCSPQEPPSKPVVDVKVARAELADIERSVRGPAAIFPRAQANISARITAPIRDLRVRKGDTVAAGQLLAALENTDLLAQRREATAVVTDAQASLEKISAGTLPTEMERASGQLRAAEAALNQARTVSERRQHLFEQGAIPNRDLLVSQTELAQAQVVYDLARKSLELLQSQSQEKDLRIAASRLEQSRARLDLIDAQVTFSELRSPFAGTITEQFLYPGDMAKPNVALFTIMDLSRAIARTQIQEADAASVRVLQACTFAPADSKDAPFRGQVSVVNGAVDTARRTVEVWCDIPNPARALRAGVFGNVSIAVETTPKSVVVPLSAVQFVQGTRNGFVMVVDDKRTARKRDVVGGEVVRDQVQITKGLQAGEVVVAEGGYGLPDGTEVRWAEEKKP